MNNPFDFGSYGGSEPYGNDPKPGQESSGGFNGGGFNRGGLGGGSTDTDGARSGSTGAGGARSTNAADGGSADSPGFGGFRGSDFGWPSTEVRSGSDTGGAVVVGKPPVIWLFLGVGVAAVGIALAALFDDIKFNIPAWVLAGPIAIGFLTVFVLADTKSQSAAVYSVQSFVPWLYRGLLLVAAVGVLLSAWRIAVWVGHL